MMQKKNMHGKPVFETNTRILNLNSGFKSKRLCDGPTFSAGTACAYSCTYCYVESIMARSGNVQKILSETGKGFQEVVIRRAKPLERLKRELRNSRGESIYKNATGVIYGSPLVDIAANQTLVHETTEICLELLNETGWTIRLLSKSTALPQIARAIPNALKNRVIFGVSTGTLETHIAKAIEPDSPPPEKRLESLKKLQNEGYRTFGMLCPIMPMENPESFVEQACEAIEIEQCEHIWAEPLNSRGSAFNKTIGALQQHGQAKTAERLIATQKNKEVWEAYTRTLFQALTKKIPGEKLRFLQYTNQKTQSWWEAQTSRGAVPLHH